MLGAKEATIVLQTRDLRQNMQGFVYF